MEASVGKVEASVGKVEARVGEVGNTVGQVGQQMGQVGSTVGRVESQVTKMESQVTSVAAAVATVESQVKRVDSHLTNVQTSVAVVAGELHDLRAQLATVETQVKTSGDGKANVAPEFIDLVGRHFEALERDVRQLANAELPSHDLMLRTELDETLPHVAGDRVQLQQVLLNLIINAIDAMRGIGDRPRALTIVSGRDGADAVLVEVRDSGTGLDPKSAERLFEAFYTTKAGGVGIGLSIARSIVEAHGGRLWAGPNEPHGAVFRFSLPSTEAIP